MRAARATASASLFPGPISLSNRAGIIASLFWAFAGFNLRLSKAALPAVLLPMVVKITQGSGRPD